MMRQPEDAEKLKHSYKMACLGEIQNNIRRLEVEQEQLNTELENVNATRVTR